MLLQPAGEAGFEVGLHLPQVAQVEVFADGLLLAGRNISGTHKAHSSFRVMPICVNIGQGAGTAAAVAVRDGVIPRVVDIAEVQKLLLLQGVKI